MKVVKQHPVPECASLEFNVEDHCPLVMASYIYDSHDCKMSESVGVNPGRPIKRETHQTCLIKDFMPSSQAVNSCPST